MVLSSNDRGAYVHNHFVEGLFCPNLSSHIDRLSSPGKSQADYYEYVPVILRELLHRLNDDSTIVLKANQKALGALTTCIPAESLVEHLGYIKNVIGSMVSDARYRKGGVGEGDFFLPGLNIPKGELEAMDGVVKIPGYDDRIYFRT